MTQAVVAVVVATDFMRGIMGGRRLRVVGVSTVVGGLLQLGIGMTAFRRGEKWAWYAIATVLLWLGFGVYISYTGERGSAINSFIQYLPYWLPQLLALLLSVRSFFAAKRGTTNSPP